MKDYKGLGDVVADFTQSTGLDKVAKKVANLAGKEDCGCGKRQEKLNKMVPFDEPTSRFKTNNKNS